VLAVTRTAAGSVAWITTRDICTEPARPDGAAAA
jgi:hypothetical protein